jgi:hypothetical protein
MPVSPRIPSCRSRHADALADRQLAALPAITSSDCRPLLRRLRAAQRRDRQADAAQHGEVDRVVHPDVDGGLGRNDEKTPMMIEHGR